MSRRRVLVVGGGDTGTLTAIGLGPHAEVTLVGTAPGLLSGQELGLRLADPASWQEDYWIESARYRGLDRVTTIHGRAVAADLDGRTVRVECADGTSAVLGYDVLVIATGVGNGFWRDDTVRNSDQIAHELTMQHASLAKAETVAIIGGGAAAVASAAQLARRWPEKSISLHYPGTRILTGHHRKVAQTVTAWLTDRGVVLHPGRRAVLRAGGAPRELTPGPVEFDDGTSVEADVVLWAVGAVRPHTAWLPRQILDEAGFVRVEPSLRVVGQSDVFAVGDVAASDPLRSTARNRADQLVIANVRALGTGNPLRQFRAKKRRWGSVVGDEANGLVVFTPAGHGIRIPGPIVRSFLRPVVVRRGIYRGIRPPRRLSP